MSSTILSTKKLSLSQKELLLNAKLRLVEYDAINIEHLEFELETGYDFYLFTSQNAIKSYLGKADSSNNIAKRAFCVGEKTRALLEANGFQVVEMAQNASQLAKIIGDGYQNNSFLFLSGNLRKEELPSILKEKNIRYKELNAYRTVLNEKEFSASFDGILFYSPSGVQSFISKNEIGNGIAFCIGDTTATEAKKYTNRLIIANKPTIENVIVQAAKYYNT